MWFFGVIFAIDDTLWAWTLKSLPVAPAT